MTPEALWHRYSAIWSLDAVDRDAELVACLADDATYCDPNGLLAGRAALSDYMGGFRRSVPGGKFRIRSVLHHHDRTLAHWALHGPDVGVLQTGTSFGALSEDGRLLAITGFFYAAAEDQPG
ncbi:MAG: nuclear transport factor 2 family protein [Stellaceae bacterium]